MSHTIEEYTRCSVNTAIASSFNRHSTGWHKAVHPPAIPLTETKHSTFSGKKACLVKNGNYLLYFTASKGDDQVHTSDLFISMENENGRSASTESYDSRPETLRDRGGKFRMYRNNPVLQDYLLVSSTAIEIDLYRKNDANEWVIIDYAEGDTVELKSINLSFPIAQIYRGLDLAPESESTI
jgi:hypothetical protein